MKEKFVRKPNNKTIEEIANSYNYSEEHKKQSLETMKEALGVVKSKLESADKTNAIKLQDVQMASSSDITMEDVQEYIGKRVK